MTTVLDEPPDHHIEIDGVPFTWGAGSIRGEALLDMVNRAGPFDLLKDHSSEPIDDDDTVVLERGTVVKFKTREGAKKITVFYNHNPVEIVRGNYSTEQLLAIFGVPSGHILDLIGPNGDFDELKLGATIKVKKGQQFVSHAPTGSSA